MKTLLLLFSIFFVIENIVIADLPQSSLLKDIYHKKVKPGFINGPKLINKRLSNARKHKLGTINKGEIRTKKPNNYGEYTVFPSHLKKEPINIPSSAYFVHEPLIDEPKLRVKKVLPDFWNVHDRKKRSPEEEVKEGPKADSEVKTVEAKANETTALRAAEGDKAGNTTNASQADNAAKPTATSKDPKAKDAKKPATTKGAKAAKPKPKIVRKPAARSSNSKKPGKRNSAPKAKGNKPKPAGRSHNKKPKAAARSKAKKPASKRSPPNKNPKGRAANRSPTKRASAKKASVSRRLIAGRDAIIEDYPYVVSIQKDGEHWCAGALLNQRLVITTANCVWKSTRMSRMKIRAGSRHLEHGGQLVNIAEVLKHPAWSIRKNPDCDLALLLTDNYVKFSHTCHAVDLPNRVMMPIFDDAWIASWGAERRDGVYVKQGLTLQVYHARLMDREKCNNVTLRFGVMVTENFICLEQIGRRAPCTRDTGAPAVSDGILWGLASWGIRKMCGTERFPAMFTYIASESNMDFIINGTKYMMSEERLSPFLDRYPFPRSRNYSSRIL